MKYVTKEHNYITNIDTKSQTKTRSEHIKDIVPILKSGKPFSLANYVVDVAPEILNGYTRV